MATKPTAPTVPNPPLRSLGSTQFVTDSEAWFTFEAGPFYTYIVDGIDYIDETNIDVQAAAVAANLFDLPLVGLGGYLVGVNDGENGFEAVEVTEYNVSAYAETLLDDADASAARATLGLGTFATESTVDYIRSQGTWDGGTSTVESVISPSKLKGVFDHNVNSEVSTAQTIASATTFTFTPTFTPERADVYLECTSAINGYSVGDKVQLGGYTDYENSRGVSVVISGGDVIARAGDSLRLLSLSANNDFFATSSNFDLYIRAYRQ